MRIKFEVTSYYMLYFNKIYLGHRAYGVAAAAQIYYGKKIDQLTLAEIAMIAGLPKAPSKYNLINDENLTNNHEDGFFSILHRSFLESKGFKWAPFLIANEFSLETPISFKDFIE